jgi:Icc-related predicted phosphoesterase
MNFVCISDTHCQVDQVALPEGDVLLHSGDLTYRGDVVEIHKELVALKKKAANFKHIVIIAGNHDWLGERNPALMKTLCEAQGITYLHDSFVVIDGIKIYGSPYQPEFCDWAFNLPRGEPLKEKWALIPDDTDVLITHGPPHQILDEVPFPRGFRAGCEDLRARVDQLPNLQLHVFGHLHMNHGSIKVGNTTFINASTCTERYKPINKPICIGIHKKERPGT